MWCFSQDGHDVFFFKTAALRAFAAAELFVIINIVVVVCFVPKTTAHAHKLHCD
jgi:hypothetical protein